MDEVRVFLTIIHTIMLVGLRLLGKRYGGSFLLYVGEGHASVCEIK